ncbi:MAG: glycosyltransferase family 4 protein, partial [Sphingomonadaceae bacterium]
TTPKSYTLPYRIWHRFQQANIGRRHARILTVSEFSRMQLAGYGVTQKDRIGVVLNGVDHGADISPDPTILDRLDLRAGKYVLALANIKAHKNIGVLLRAFARPELSDTSLMLFGADGRAQFEQQGMSIPQNVRFAGKIDDAQLRALYKSALCLAFPSLTEGFGLPPLEAMREGCPSVVSPTGALPEVCGDAAIYADPHDPAAWAAEILKLTNDAALRQTLVQRGKEQAARFTWDKAARTLIRELMSI